jgi:hypothetical protein
MSWFPDGGADLPNQYLIGSTASTPAEKIGENVQAHSVRFSLQFLHHRDSMQGFPVAGVSSNHAWLVDLSGFPCRFLCRENL